MIAADLRKRRPKPHTSWHLDEVFLKIDGRTICLKADLDQYLENLPPIAPAG